jgi:serine/threonine-protein kinase PknK
MPEDLPPRYEPQRRLGAGGGGEVWGVRDRVSGRVLALKVLSRSAGEAEIDALVQEAVALSGLEGLGVPRVIAFGALRDGRRYMVRELVDGRSLDDVLHGDDGAPWIAPLASACDQLTVVHRSGLLHGDVKPANIIVGADGRGTLVDLGLAAPWREGGTAARGLTPKYAAPELFEGEPLTVRAEVYALGATLSEALARRGDELGDDVRIALAKVAARATETAAACPLAERRRARERAEASGRAGGVGGERGDRGAAVARAGARRDVARAARAEGASAGGRPRAARPARLRAGRRSCARLAWTLGVQGRAVALIEAPKSGMAMADVVELELAQHVKSDAPPVVIVDDAEELDATGRAALRRAVEVGRAAGGRRAAHDRVGPDDGSACGLRRRRRSTRSAAAELVHRSVPSLPDALRAYLVERVGGRPGVLRAAVRRLAGRPVVSRGGRGRGPRHAAVPVDAAPVGRYASGARVQAERALEMGRFDEAAQALDGNRQDPRTRESACASALGASAHRARSWRHDDRP